MKTNIYEMSTERTKALKTEIQSSKRELSVIRGQAFTDIYRTKAHSHPYLKRADAFREYFQRLPVYIFDNELLVGGITEKRRGAFLVPENNTDGMQIHNSFIRCLFRILTNLLNTAAKAIAVIHKPAGDRLRILTRVLSITKMTTIEDRPSIGFSPDRTSKDIIKKNIMPYWKKKSAHYKYTRTLSGSEKRYMNSFLYSAEHAFVGGVFLFYPPLEIIATEGLQSIITKINDKIEHLDPEEKDYGSKLALYNASAISAKAIIDYANRYAALAEQEARLEVSAKRRKELLEIAEICRHVPANPAVTFREALQSLWFGYIAIAGDDGGHEVPFGRWDQILYPYYKNDVNAGKISKAEVLELLECFILKTNEVEYLLHNGASFFEDGNSGRITLTIGGVDKEGNDATNELSYLFIQALSNTRMIQPNPAVRIHKNSPKDFTELVLSVMSSGANTIQLFNDDEIIDGFINEGFAIGESRDYIISGCVQPIPRATYGSVCAGHLILPRIFEIFLNKKENYSSYADFFSAFKKYTGTVIAHMAGTLGKVDLSHDNNIPNTFIDSTFDGVLESGKEIKKGGAKYNLTGISLLGIGTLSDSLMAVKRTVFQEKRYSLNKLRKLCRNNFHRHEADRRYLINNVPKYGNDIDEVDSIIPEITGFIKAEISKYRSHRNGKFSIGIHSENGHVLLGMLTGATPDGRLQQTPFSIGAGSARGNEKMGYTASLKSFSKISNKDVISGVSVNLRINPSLVDSEIKQKLFADMLHVYFFNLGGQNLQTTIVSRETLIQAKESPENYQDLIVRISGYSARFVDLTAQTQNEIISRTEYT